MPINYIIYAVGLRGDVEGKVFVPYREEDGTFPIFSEELRDRHPGSAMQEAKNKVPDVKEISEAVGLIRAGRHHWRLRNYNSGQKNIFKPEHIRIHEI